MKIKIIISIIALNLILVSSPVFAETRSTTITPKTVRNEIRNEIREKKEEKKEELQTKLNEAKQKKIQSLFDAIKNGLVKRHEAIIKIKNKISARITNNPMNKDTTKAKEELAKFEAANNLYKADLAALETKFVELKASTKPSEIIKTLKDNVKIVRDDLDSLKKILKTTILALAQAPKLEVTKTQ